MIELKHEDIQKVKPLFDTIFGSSWFVEQVKQGIGAIYIQDKNGKTAVMVTPSSEYFFVGLYDDDFLKEALNHIQTHIIPQLEDPIGFFYYGSTLWHDGLVRWLEQPIDPEYGRYLTRQYYRLNVDKYEECKRQLRPLDDHYQIRIESDPYKASIRYQQAVVGFAINNGLSDGIMDIDVYTHEDHRKKGLALHTTTKLIDHALLHGWTPQWGCWSVNMASVGLAKKLGFELLDSQLVIFVSYV